MRGVADQKNGPEQAWEKKTNASEEMTELELL